ncbi:Membrane-bound lytic murein transglycosylase D [Candidatus Entotheonellaceae bacterium PAL068K]
MRWGTILMVLAGVWWHVAAHAARLDPASFPSLVSALRQVKQLSFCGERVPLESQEVRERFEKQLLLTLWNRPQVLLWLKRSRRYLPRIEALLRASGMPDDLKYIAIAESALQPHLGSSKGALGFWQFVKQTGARYGLKINDFIDERRNFSASTRAAMAYLQELYETFGAWTLAAAAFNMGENGLRAEILEQDTQNYYQLYLPLETQRYVFRILSVKLIVADPKRYGFELSKHEYYPAINAESLSIDTAQDTPIRIIARAAKTSFKQIKDLNPEIRGYYLRKGQHTLLIPQGSSQDFQRRYKKGLEHWLADQQQSIYVVKPGDNLSIIAQRFNVPLAALLIWNRLDLKAPIHPGDRLVVYRGNLQIE